MFYTLLASLPLLVGILFVYNSLGSLFLFLLYGDNFLVGNLFYICIIFAFLVSMPIFMVHLWLPEAHIEAPFAGSIILAGVLLTSGVMVFFVYILCSLSLCLGSVLFRLL